MSFRNELFGTFAKNIVGRYQVSVETLSARVPVALSPTARAQKPGVAESHARSLSPAILRFATQSVESVEYRLTVINQQCYKVRHLLNTCHRH